MNVIKLPWEKNSVNWPEAWQWKWAWYLGSFGKRIGWMSQTMNNGPKKSHFRRAGTEVLDRGISSRAWPKAPTRAQIQKALHPQREGAGHTDLLRRGWQAGTTDRLGSMRKRAPGNTMKEWQPQHIKLFLWRTIYWACTSYQVLVIGFACSPRINIPVRESHSIDCPVTQRCWCSVAETDVEKALGVLALMCAEEME